VVIFEFMQGHSDSIPTACWLTDFSDSEGKVTIGKGSVAVRGRGTVVKFTEDCGSLHLLCRTCCTYRSFRTSCYPRTAWPKRVLSTQYKNNASLIGKRQVGKQPANFQGVTEDAMFLKWTIIARPQSGARAEVESKDARGADRRQKKNY